jgi:hypothetical protein
MCNQLSIRVKSVPSVIWEDISAGSKEVAMFLKTVFVRFYKSFNYDYLRKFNVDVTRRYPWEFLDEQTWYPFVRIPIDSKITTVVGANESGKTHLLTAIEKGIRGIEIERSDFCRYSQFFTVEYGKMRWPDFGFEWSGLSSPERQSICQFFGITKPAVFDSFLVFRTNKETLTAYIPRDGDYTVHQAAAGGTAFADQVPNVFRLRENIALPESAPIRWLAEDSSRGSRMESLPRKTRVTFLETLFGHSTWFSTKESVTKSADDIVQAFDICTPDADSTEPAEDERRLAELRLARDLIRKVARIDAKALQELLEALRDGKDAFANSIIDAINSALTTALNFPHWWVQDKDFRLLVSPRDYDLVFTICDRTGREYSFGERSSGLKYFLSYYIQYLAHQPSDGRREILLMDEPDAYLSSQGQQDLLKIFDAFANPEDSRLAPTQVIYVTHSPFLIDKNHGDRIRVLEKGVGDEGTRVVRNVSRNHYEPLRSAFGSFVAETTFIGHCNLIVEGPADQILLAGAASLLRAHGAGDLETLDLNKITIVPAGGEGHVPYLVYLARGRDVEKPAVIVLLDSDDGGNNAKKGLQRGGPKKRQVLKPEHVLQIGDLTEPPTSMKNAAGHPLVEIEDLIPLPICVDASRRYLREFCDVSDETAAKMTGETILKKCVSRHSIFDAIEVCFTDIDRDLHIDKVGFARMAMEVITEMAVAGHEEKEAKQASAQFFDNMKILFRNLRKMQRSAERELTVDRVSQRVDRAKQAFLQDHPTDARREHAFVLLEDIEDSLDSSLEADEIRTQLRAIRRDFKVEEDITQPVPDYPRFKERLENLKYAGRLATQTLEVDHLTAVGHSPQPESAADSPEQSLPSNDDRQPTTSATTSLPPSIPATP